MIMNGSLGIYFEVSFFEEYLKLILYGNFFELNATTWIKIFGITSGCKFRHMLYRCHYSILKFFPLQNRIFLLSLPSFIIMAM